jgi:Family of unknown function (DUF6065)
MQIIKKRAGTTMELICYIYDGWKPRIKPANSKRKWMDQSPEAFAYRCLPLSIANSHGWEMLSPCAFEAMWTGGDRPEDVIIRVDKGYDTPYVPVALFGQATFTFHIEGIFRTPQGWNLWVGGPPNYAKDGIAPLSGVIETDWSPYGFTMNWQFTRANHWVRFEENEPFMFFFPVQRAGLEVVEPKLLPITDNPELKQQFESWSASRNAFQEHVKRHPPSAPSEKWQKLYYRGVYPDGTKGAEDHCIKQRLNAFDASACPHVQPKGSE